MGHPDPVAIFWDYENCAPPSGTPGYDIVNNIRQLAQTYGSIRQFKAYLDLSELSSPKSITFRSELQQCGVSLTDCPHNGRKDVADKMIIVDMLAFAIDTSAPATVILISGDRDFVYAVSVLRFRLYRVVVIAPVMVHISLISQASDVIDWESDILGRLRPRPAATDSPRHNAKNSDGDNSRLTTNQANTQLATPRLRRRGSLRDSTTANSSSPDSRPDVSPNSDQTIIQPAEGAGAQTAVRGSRLRDSRAAANNALSQLSTVAHGSPSVISTGLSEQTEKEPLAQDQEYHSESPSSRGHSLLPLWSGKPQWNSLPSPQKSPGFDYEPITRPASAESALMPFRASYILPHSTEMNVVEEPLPLLRHTSEPQMIGHESGVHHHSLGFQMPTPVQEAIVNLSQDPIPPGFELLVALLDHLRKQNRPKPLRSYVSGTLVQLDPEVYHKAWDKYENISATKAKFSWYSDLAKKCGLIELGGLQGGAWMSLCPQWHGRGIPLGLIYFRDNKPYITRPAAHL